MIDIIARRTPSELRARGSLFALLLILLSAPNLVAAQGPAAAVLRGRITDPSGAPVAQALVELLRASDGAQQRITLAGEDGSYRLGEVLPGAYRLRVQRLGFEPHTQAVELSPGQMRSLDVRLATATVQIEGLVVSGTRTTNRERTRFDSEGGVTARVVTATQLKVLPGLAEADVLRAVEALPGVVSTSDFSSAFNVRGGSADQNLILLDGFPIFNPFHLGGLFSVFNSDVIAGAELLTGGFGAEHGGRVSSVLNVETRDFSAEPFGGEAGASLLATRLSLHGALPTPAALRGGWFLSARRSYFDKLLPPKVGLPYHLTDLQGGVSLATPRGGKLRLTAYTGEDVLDMSKREPESGTADSEEGDGAGMLRVKWGWGNDVLGLRWDQPWGGWVSTARLGTARYNESFGLVDFDGQLYRSRMEQSFARAELSRDFVGGLSLRLGAEGSRLRSRNLSEAGGATFWDAGARGTMGGAFSQLRWRPTDAWILEPGLRLDAWAADDTTFVLLSPRLSAKRFLGAERDAAVKLAVGRYTQFLHSLRDETLPISNDVWVVAGRSLPAVTSDQVLVGVEAYWGEGWSASAESYARRFRGLVTNNIASDLNDPADEYLQGRGHSYGLDLQLRKEQGRLTGWTTLSLLRAERSFPDPLARDWEDVPPETTFAPGFDRRLSADLVLQYTPARNTEIGLRWKFGSGLPYTRPVAQHVAWEYDPSTGRYRIPAPTGNEEPDSPPMYVVLGPRNGARYPAYHRLDVSLRRTLERRWGTATPYLQVLNVYNRKNPLFYFYNYAESPATRSGISMFPVLPTIGMEVSF